MPYCRWLWAWATFHSVTWFPHFWLSSDFSSISHPLSFPFFSLLVVVFLSISHTMIEALSLQNGGLPHLCSMVVGLSNISIWELDFPTFGYRLVSAYFLLSCTRFLIALNEPQFSVILHVFNWEVRLSSCVRCLSRDQIGRSFSWRCEKSNTSQTLELCSYWFRGSCEQQRIHNFKLGGSR